MKKISLRGISEILSERELKNVVGGVGFDTLAESPERELAPGEGGGGSAGGGTCAAYLPSPPTTFPGIYTGNYNGGYSNGSYEQNPQYAIHRGLSKAVAQAMVQGIAGAKWCCDNCSSASWY
jgi:hypothetical protein